MINQDSIQAVQAARFNEHFGKPLYESYCFSQLSQTIYHLLTGDGAAGLPESVLGDLPHRYDRVILLLIDAFGWRFFERYHERYPFLKRFVDEGVVSKLTTQFPSTTTAHITTIQTGLTPLQSGVYEWFYYEPLVDRIIMPLLFSYAGDRERETLQATGIPPEKFFPQQTLHHRLNAHGVESTAFQDRELTPSSYSDIVFAGAHLAPYRTISEALVNLAHTVLEAREPGYFFLYFGNIDTIGHHYGPESPQFTAEVDTFMTMLERLLHPALSGQLKNTLLLVTADHGQIAVSPETTIYLNRLSPSIEPWIKTNRRGDLLVPAGSARDMFLYIQDQHLNEAHDLLTRQLEGRAAVYRTQDLIAQGFFGPGEPSQQFLDRVGNLVILPYEHETVWWYEKDVYEQGFYGHHGGLAREEMETILLALSYV
jgi:predicted AlkP superfamily pyrophosphatase or phosphodiesterase